MSKRVVCIVTTIVTLIATAILRHSSCEEQSFGVLDYESTPSVEHLFHTHTRLVLLTSRGIVHPLSWDCHGDLLSSLGSSLWSRFLWSDGHCVAGTRPALCCRSCKWRRNGPCLPTLRHYTRLNSVSCGNIVHLADIIYSYHPTILLPLSHPWRGTRFFFQNAQTGSGAHPAYYSMGTGVLSCGVKSAWAWTWPLNTIYRRGQEWVELYLYSSIRLHDMDKDSVTFYFITLFITD